MFEAGDPFLLQIDLYNGTVDTLNIQQFLLLDVYGMFFFHPSWGTAVDFVDRHIVPGYNEIETILDFTWPGNVGSANDLRFWLGYFDPMAQVIVGEIDTAEFGYK